MMMTSIPPCGARCSCPCSARRPRRPRVRARPRCWRRPTARARLRTSRREARRRLIAHVRILATNDRFAGARGSATPRPPSTGSIPTPSRSASPAASPRTSGSTSWGSTRTGRSRSWWRLARAGAAGRQGASPGRGGQADRAGPVPAQGGARRRGPDRLPRGLRPRAGAGDGRRLRPLGQPAPTAPGGRRHQ